NYMKKLLVGLMILSSVTSFAAETEITHKSCGMVLSVGSYGRYVMQKTYRLDMDGYANTLKEALRAKGYNVTNVLNYGDYSAFGQQGIQESIKNESLALEFRVSAPSYNDGVEKHRCAGGI